MERLRERDLNIAFAIHYLPFTIYRLVVYKPLVPCALIHPLTSRKCPCHEIPLFLVLAVFACSLSVPVSAQTPRYARVISANANLRDIPAIAGGSEQEVAEDTIVKVLDEKLPWYVVRVGNRVGWMHRNIIEFIRTQDSATEPQSQQMIVPEQVPPHLQSNVANGPPFHPRPQEITSDQLRTEAISGDRVVGVTT